MSKPEVSRRNADGDRIAVIHSYAPGDGNLSFVASDVEPPHSAIFPSPSREECKAACPEDWELYQEGFSWRARKSATTSQATATISLPPTLKREDFSFRADAQGYMIQYKGQNIGGAGILGKYKGAGRAPRGFASRAQQQAQEYTRQAESEIHSLVIGVGQARFRTVINEIDSDQKR
jgi:hypothetical protein